MFYKTNICASTSAKSVWSFFNLMVLFSMASFIFYKPLHFYLTLCNCQLFSISQRFLDRRLVSSKQLLKKHLLQFSEITEVEVQHFVVEFRMHERTDHGSACGDTKTAPRKGTVVFLDSSRRPREKNEEREGERCKELHRIMSLTYAVGAFMGVSGQND